MFMYGIGFFIATILIQYLFYKVKHNTPQRTNGIMVGTNAIVAICVLGVISHNVYFFSAVIGLAMADKLGRKWNGVNNNYLTEGIFLNNDSNDFSN